MGLPYLHRGVVPFSTDSVRVKTRRLSRLIESLVRKGTRAQQKCHLLL